MAAGVVAAFPTALPEGSSTVDVTRTSRPDDRATFEASKLDWRELSLDTFHTCASGGRRDDIETFRRSVPLWRSDDSGNPVVEQNHTYGLALWVPYFGSGIARTDSYGFRSVLGSSLVASWDLRDKKYDYDNLRELTAEFWRAASYFVGDYYPLTPFPSGTDNWMAWQFNRPERGDGVVQAFFRDENNNQVEPPRNLRLRGLDPAATYQVTDFDAGTPTTFSGGRLMQEGLQVQFLTKPGAAVFTYRKVG